MNVTRHIRPLIRWVLARCLDVLIPLSLGALMIAFMAGMSLGSIALIASFETRWASDYSEWQFHWVKAGDTKAQVRARLGEPLRRSVWEDTGQEYWFYTESPNSTHYWLRTVIFNAAGHVKDTHSELYVD